MANKFLVPVLVWLVISWAGFAFADESSPATSQEEAIKGLPPHDEKYRDKVKAQEQREAERRKKIQEAIEKDQSILRPKRSPLDFSNNAITLGEPYLGGGEIKDYGLTWLGDEANAVRPRAQLYGTLSSILFGGRLSGRDLGQLGYNLDLDFNFDLTNTERFHVQYKPFVDRDTTKVGGLYRFHEHPDDPSTADHRFELSADNTFAWFEGEIGEMFDFISPKDRVPTDYHIALGLLPVLYQNNYLMNDNVLGGLLSKPNITVLGATNIVLQGMFGFEDINASTAGGDGDSNQNNTNLYGLTARVEYPKQFWELNYFHMEDKVQTAETQDWAAVSLSSTYGLLNYAIRALFNFNDDRTGGGAPGDGQLYVFEMNHPVLIEDYYDNNYVYFNWFYGTDGWNDIAGGRAGRAGIAFRGNGVTSFAVMRNTGVGSIGGALGLKAFYLREELSINPEFAWLFDNHDSVGGSPVTNDQFAFALEVQYLLSNHLSVVSKLVGIHNETREEDYGSSLEMRFKF